MSDLRDALRTLHGLDVEVDGIVADLIGGSEVDDSADQKWLALCSELGDEMLDAEESAYDDCVFGVGRAEYLVLTEDERDSRWDDCLESYLDDGCVEGADSPYFDRESWKNDARMDGAGHALSVYDGSEYECKVCDEWFYIYRIN